jgi:Flp pilus assembly protein TadG
MNTPMNRTKNRTRKARQGVATVELAFVLPAFIALVFGSIEICQRLQVKQSAVIAAYEACRVATRPISNTAAVQAHAEQLLLQQNVQGATVTIRNITQAKNNLDDIATGDEIRIRVVVPWSANTISHYVIGDSGGDFSSPSVHAARVA